TRFDIGSINKIFTTTAIHQLAQQGKLALDDSIARFLPDYPAQAARKITIRMLLEHRSGVPDVLEMPELWKNALAVRTADDWYRLIRDQPLEFEPGTRERYSNGGFVILGMIVQRVSGEDYYAYMRDHLYRPAHMSRTDSYEADRLPADVAVRYTNDTDSRAPAALAPGGEQAVTSTLGRGSAAGGGYSTVGDLVRFARAMRAHVLLDASHTDAVIGPGAALGIAGGSPGVNALVELSGPFTLVALANLDPPAAERLAKTVGRMVRRAAGTPPPLGPSPH
ncbi:MAG TPA: serine hydrolase domain-containing protein, partial [Dongiaceae bacterium]|nr:serine hydrolase domain-containing protein [Dongiaceae bacterium]